MRKFTTGQRLREYMVLNNVRQVDILNKSLPYQKKFNIKMSKSHLSNYVNDRSSPDNSKMKLLAAALNVSEPWLMGYDVDNKENSQKIPDPSESNLVQIFRKLTQPRKEKAESYIRGLLDEQQFAFGSIPNNRKVSKNALVLERKNAIVIYPNVIGAAAGVGTSHHADLDFDEIMIPATEAYEHNYILPMYVRGDSMEPKYFDGDIIWVDTYNKSIEINQIGVFDTIDGRVVKRRGTDELVSLNKKYPSIELNEFMDFSTFGKVIDVIRKEELEEWQTATWV